MPNDVVLEGSGAGSSNAPFSFGTRLGMVFIIQAAFLSLIAVVSLLCYIAYAALRLRRDARRRWDVSTPLHWYFLSMMISELIQATGSIMNLKWVIDADVVDGQFCTAQGVLKQIGDVSVALATLAIAIHTFRAIVFRWAPEHPQLIGAIVLSTIWITIVLIMAISSATHKNKEYWGDTQYWCWITSSYPVQQIVLDYVFMWVTAFLNIALYIPLALVIKGIVTVNGFSVRVTRDDDRMDANSRVTHPGRGIDGIAMQMLFYPLIYTVTVLPIAIVRFRAFYSQHVPFAATAFADVLFSLSGFFNVILFALTRPALLPRRNSDASPHAISFSLRSRNTITDPEQPFVARPSLAVTRPRMGTLPDDSNPDFDGGWMSDGPDQLALTKERLSPSFTSFDGTK